MDDSIRKMCPFGLQKSGSSLLRQLLHKHCTVKWTETHIKRETTNSLLVYSLTHNTLHIKRKVVTCNLLENNFVTKCIKQPIIKKFKKNYLRIFYHHGADLGGGRKYQLLRPKFLLIWFLQLASHFEIHIKYL